MPRRTGLPEQDKVGSCFSQPWAHMGDHPLIAAFLICPTGLRAFTTAMGHLGTYRPPSHY